MLEPSIISYLENEVLHLKINKICPIHRGGTSQNYRLVLSDRSYLLKVFELNKNSTWRSERLLLIDQFLSQSKSLQTPHFFENKFFTSENHIFLLTDFIDGERISASKLSFDVLSSLAFNEKILEKLSPANASFLYPILTPNDLFLAASEDIKKLKLQKYSFFRFIESYLSDYLFNLYTQTPKLSTAPVIIHSDTKPDNFILKEGKLIMLDFEMIRLGYTVEDLAQFLLSLVLQHSVWFWDKKKFSFILSFFTKTFNLQKEDWIYGINMYFLRLITRRVCSPSLFKSPRKSWLFILHLKKHQEIMKLIENYYFGLTGK